MHVLFLSARKIPVILYSELSFIDCERPAFPFFLCSNATLTSLCQDSFGKQPRPDAFSSTSKLFDNEENQQSKKR